MNVNCVIVIIAGLVCATTAQGQEPIECPNSNEEYQVCGNLCEDTCRNNCAAPVQTLFSALEASNPDCVAGCYCKADHIRNTSGECVPNVPGVCASDRCGRISKNSVYKRCMTIEGTCARRSIRVRLSGYRGRCVCEEGYLMNLQRKCIKADSKACTKLSSTTFNKLNLQTTYDC